MLETTRQLFDADYRRAQLQADLRRAVQLAADGRFARFDVELMMGGGAQPPRPPATLPRQTARRRNGKPQKNTPRGDEHDEAEITS